MQNHPLFPPLNDDDDSPEVQAIHVSRFENGNQPYCAYMFGPEELTDLQTVFELFGGGKYELVARADNRISAKRRYELAGRPKPLVMGNSDPQETQQVSPSVAHSAPLDGGGMMLAVIQMMQQSNQQQQQMFLAMMNQTTAMMTAMVNRDSESSKTMLQAMSQNNERALQGQAQVFQAMIEATGKQGGGKELLNAYREGLGDGATDEEGGTDQDGVMSTMKTAVEGMRVLTALTGDAPVVAQEAVS